LTGTKVTIHAAARRDLVDHYRWLNAEAGRDVAERFLLAADAEFAALAATPGMGSAVKARHPHLAGIRKWRVGGFPNILIFYQRRRTGVSIVRVIHAARDWWAFVGVVS
jgi:toxin ParE1/3/4